MSGIIQINEAVNKSLRRQQGEKLLFLNVLEAQNSFRKQMENTCK